MAVVKGEAIVIICMSSLYRNPLKDNSLLRCTYSTLNINNQNDNQAAKMTSEDINEEISIEMINKKEIKETEDLAQKTEEGKINVGSKEDQDHLREIHLWKENS